MGSNSQPPLSDTYYYDSSQLHADDIPPDARPLGKTLGSTDGAGYIWLGAS